MNSNEAKEEIRSRSLEYLTPDSTGKGYICPVCGSGSGKHGTGITTRDGGKHFTCWAGCYTNADIIDIIGMERAGIPADDQTKFPEKLRAAAEVFGIRIDGDTKLTPSQKNTTKQSEREPVAPAPEADYSAFFTEAEKHITETDYPQQRGLSAATLQHFHIGYCPGWTHPKAPNAPRTPRLIIPTSRSSYLARDTRSEIPEEQKQYSKSKAGAAHIFNLDALQTADKPIFIVEGEIDAMSIYEIGGEAVALGSVNMYKKLIEAATAQKPAHPLIISLDNDEAGEQTAAKLLDGLKAAGIPCYKFNVSGTHKDANEALKEDVLQLVQSVGEIYNHSDDLEGYERELRGKEYRAKNSAASHLQDFINGIAASVSTPATTTGIKALDRALDGGLYAGLYTMGAISSLGKTTLALQIADHIAKSGKDVLIISLEMARSELMAKSISRLTITDVLDNGGDTGDAKTTRGILDGTRYSHYSKTERELINRSISTYAKFAEHIYILEGMGNISTREIRDFVQIHKAATGNVPIIFVDYLQILAPVDLRMSDKQNVDNNVVELKRISRDYNTTVFVISALNRDNYYGEIHISAFKESGSIEYGSDVLIGLQYRGAKSKADIETAMKENPRKVQIKILKQRNGDYGGLVDVDFYPRFNFFTEA